MKKPVNPNDLKTSTEGARTSTALDSKSHRDLFAKAMKAFSTGDFKAAKEMFDKAMHGPELSVNESARMYSRMCEQRLDRAKPALKTADDYYNYAISLMNLRRTAEAAANLKKAIELGDTGYIRYAMALACGLEGDIPAAAAHLQRAIDMDPATRTHARTDSDFQPLMHDAVIRDIINGARSSNL